MSPRPLHLSDDLAANIAKRDKLVAEIERIKSHLDSCECADSDWAQRAQRAMCQFIDDLATVEEWLVRHDRDLLRQATELLGKLESEGCEFSGDELVLLELLDERQENQ